MNKLNLVVWWLEPISDNGKAAPKIKLYVVKSDSKLKFCFTKVYSKSLIHSVKELQSLNLITTSMKMLWMESGLSFEASHLASQLSSASHGPSSLFTAGPHSRSDLLKKKRMIFSFKKGRGNYYGRGRGLTSAED